jgi:hypothetical protein
MRARDEARAEDPEAAGERHTFGVALSDEGSQSPLHYPDLLLVADWGRAAFELQLVHVSPSRLDAILGGYARQRAASVVTYLVSEPSIGRVVMRAVDRLGLSGLVRVQRVTSRARRRGSGVGRGGRRGRRRERCGTLVSRRSWLPESRNLAHLRVTGPSLKSLDGIERASALRTVNCWYSSVRDLRALTALEHLQDVNVSHTKVDDLAAMAGCQAIRQLSVDTTPIRTLVGVDSLHELRVLTANRCSDLTDIGALGGLEHLRRVDFIGCTSLADISPLARAPRLRYVDLESCFKVTSLEALRGSNQLEWIDISGCAPDLDLRPLASCPRLRTIRAYGLANSVAAAELRDRSGARVYTSSARPARVEQVTPRLMGMSPADDETTV